MQCECFCDEFGFLVVLWMSRREIWWTNWINRSIHLGAVHSTCGSAMVRCGSTTPRSLRLRLVVTFPRWIDVLVGFIHHMLSPTQNVITIPIYYMTSCVFILNYALEIVWWCGKTFENGFAKKEEGGHELVEILSAAVPLLVCDSATLSRHHCP